jgi:hypothetical protein
MKPVPASLARKTSYARAHRSHFTCSREEDHPMRASQRRIRSMMKGSGHAPSESRDKLHITWAWMKKRIAAPTEIPVTSTYSYKEEAEVSAMNRVNEKRYPDFNRDAVAPYLIEGYRASDGAHEGKAQDNESPVFRSVRTAVHHHGRNEP